MLLSVSSPPPAADAAEEEKQVLNPTAAGTTGTTGTAGLSVSEQVNGSIKATEEARPATEEGRECLWHLDERSLTVSGGRPSCALRARSEVAGLGLEHIVRLATLLLN